MSGFKSSGIKISLGGPKKTEQSSVGSKPTVASVFNNDSDSDEPEEMPAEARIRMRNIGKNTPTSAGPNSFGKTSRGFTDRRAELEKQLREQLEDAEKQSAVEAQSKRKKCDHQDKGDSNAKEDGSTSPVLKRARDADGAPGGALRMQSTKSLFTDTVQDDDDRDSS